MQSAYYLTISECPLMAWENVFKDGYSKIRKPGVKFKFTAETDYDAWDLLFVDWQEKVKQDPDFEQYQKDRKRLNELMIQFIKKEVKKENLSVSDRRLLNEIRRMQILLKKYEKNLGQGNTINQNLQALSKAQGYQLKKHDLTVEDYFNLIEMHSKKSVNNG